MKIWPQREWSGPFFHPITVSYILSQCPYISTVSYISTWFNIRVYRLNFLTGLMPYIGYRVANEHLVSELHFVHVIIVHVNPKAVVVISNWSTSPMYIIYIGCMPWSANYILCNIHYLYSANSIIWTSFIRHLDYPVSRLFRHSQTQPMH